MLHTVLEILVAMLAVYGGYTLFHELLNALERRVLKKRKEKDGKNRFDTYGKQNADLFGSDGDSSGNDRTRNLP